MTSSRASSTRPMSGKHEDRAHGGAGTRPVTSTDARTSDFVYPRGGEVIGEHRIEVFTGIECTPTVKRRCDVGRTSSAHNPLQYLAFRIAATNDVERGIRLHGCRHTRDPMHEHGRSGDCVDGRVVSEAHPVGEVCGGGSAANGHRHDSRGQGCSVVEKSRRCSPNRFTHFLTARKLLIAIPAWDHDGGPMSPMHFPAHLTWRQPPTGASICGGTRHCMFELSRHNCPPPTEKAFT
jgi:hypothetical protein